MSVKLRRWAPFGLGFCWSLQPALWYFTFNPGPHDPDSFMFRVAFDMAVTSVMFTFTVLYVLRLMGNRDD